MTDHFGHNSPWKSRGMTLVEILIVVALIASMMTIAAVSMGVIGHADVHGEALRLSSAIRYTFNAAATSNTTLQMQLDFENRTFTVDKLDTHGGLSAETLRGATYKSESARQERRTDDRASRLDDEDARFGSVTRTTLDDVFISGEDAKLKDGVYFVGVMTSHHDEIQTDGIGTLNFFANGFVERSVIFLGDEDAAQGLDGIVYTISLNPLTGQSSVTPGRMEISSSFFEEEEDN
ncbi:MAG: Tfp pilus assembly protein FimT/FimU [Bradymonadia bacterium]